MGQCQLQPRACRNAWSHSAILGDRGPAARDFAALTAARLMSTVLPFSERESLIRTAARRGIDRFEANLLIAAVQHQMGIGRQRSQEKWSKFGFGLSTKRVSFLQIPGRMIEMARDQLSIGWRWASVKSEPVVSRVAPAIRVMAAIGAIVVRIIAASANELVVAWRWVRRMWPLIGSRLLPATAVLAAIVAPIGRHFENVWRLVHAKWPRLRAVLSPSMAAFVTLQMGIVAAVWYLMF